MRSALGLVVGVIIAATIPLGCAPRAPAPVARSAPEPPPQRFEEGPVTMILGSEELAGNVKLGPSAMRMVGKLPQARVAVENVSPDRYNLEYRFDWVDAAGFPIETATAWHRFSLTPNQSQSFTSVGKKPEASRVKFMVRLPDDAFIDSDRAAPR